MFRILKISLKFFGILFAVLFFIFVGIILYVQVRFLFNIQKTADELPNLKYAIVLGAGILADGSPSKELSDRMTVAIDLYKKKKVEKLLLSGDGVSDKNYDEVKTMNDLAILAGVRQKDIFIDSMGVRTLKSCERAKNVYEIDEAVIITQRFHLGRALFLCESYGIKSYGLIADKEEYDFVLFNKLREVPASLIAFIEVFVHPLPDFDLSGLNLVLRNF